MQYKVLLVGAGQLGSRYLQGLSLCPLDLDVTVVDPSGESLDQARSRWGEVAGQSAGEHVITYSLSLPGSGKAFDLAIVSTSANGRARLIKQCAERFAIRYWVVEKVLAQSPAELDVIEHALQGMDGVWVNTPRRIIPWHQQIRDALAIQGPVTCSVTGGDWGLACNAVHMLDLVSWWTGQDLTRVDTARLRGAWHESKRPGYYEVYGDLSALYADGSVVTLTSVPNNDKTIHTVMTDGVEWVISEANGIATSSRGVSLPGSLDFQSSLTGPLVESILRTGVCGLPALSESLKVHRPFIAAMLEHWNRTMPEKREYVLLT